MPDLAAWQAEFADFVSHQCGGDPAHDMQHVKRVVANSRKIAAAEKADLWILIPAAWLHDCVHVAKNSAARSQASQLAADRAVQFLREKRYPDEYLDSIHHAITAHSYSAGIAPRTLEAKVLQDADRLDALGAIGLSRCLMLGGHLGIEMLSPTDPFCRTRPPDDTRFVLDHFFSKLLKLADSMQTESGLRMAQERTEFLLDYLRTLDVELQCGEM